MTGLMTTFRKMTGLKNKNKNLMYINDFFMENKNNIQIYGHILYIIVLIFYINN